MDTGGICFMTYRPIVFPYTCVAHISPVAQRTALAAKEDYFCGYHFFSVV